MGVALYSYGIALGSNQSSLTNIETLVGRPPTVNPDQQVPIGSVRRRTLDGTVHSHGTKVVVWVFSYLPQTKFDTLITTIWTDYDTENALVTINTRDRDNTFTRYNANAILPIPGENYERVFGGGVRNLRLEFRISGVAS